ncbi:hypothetical protein [Pseudomonas sp. S2_E02]
MYYRVQIPEIEENLLTLYIEKNESVLAIMYTVKYSPSEEESDEVYGCQIDYGDRLTILKVHTLLTDPRLISEKYGDNGQNGVLFFKNGIMTASQPSLSGIRAMTEKNL